MNSSTLNSSRKHSEIEVHLGPARDDGSHAVSARLDDGSRFDGGRLQLDDDKLRLAELDPEAFGVLLFNALFSGDIRRAFDQALGRAKERTDGRLRVRLSIDPLAPELHLLPWERLYHNNKGSLVPLATTAHTPFSRYVPLEIGDEDPVTERPLRILVAASNPLRLPSGLHALDVDNEVVGLMKATRRLVLKSQVNLTFLPGRTGLSELLQDRLENAGYRVADGATTWSRILELLTDHHVLHFIGHGAVSRRTGVPALYLEDEDGSSKITKAEDLVPGLATMDPVPRLVYLSACDSAKTPAGSPNPFVGLAPRLVREGKIPAVVGMQDLVPMNLATKLSSRFYRRLLRHGVVDRALNEARSLLYDADSTDWAIPVLFMRLREGQLFAADPTDDALEAIARDTKDPFEPLAVEAVHLRGVQEPGDIDAISPTTPALELMQALELVFAAMTPVKRKVHELVQRLKKRPLTTGERFVVLVGRQGMTKTTQLRRIACETATRSVGQKGGETLVPVLVDLKTLGEASNFRNPVEEQVLKTLKSYWPTLEARSFEQLREAFPSVQLRILIDGSDELSESQRRDVWHHVQRLVQEGPEHEYLLSVDAAHYEPDNLAKATDVLVLQPLSDRIVSDFLRRSGRAGQDLEKKLIEREMFDLAALPWLLVRLLDQAGQGVFPSARSKVLSELVSQSKGKIDRAKGMRSGAERLLNSLAWQMLSSNASEWPLDDLFTEMREVRGNREHGLEDLLDQLMASGLLSRLGDHAVRFAHEAVQDQCCAQALAQMDSHTRDRFLDDIAASLGTPTRLNRWQGTLILLTGLLPDPNQLLGKLLHGAALSEGDQVFLAARCLQEAFDQHGYDAVDSSRVDQVVDALVWRLDPRNERLTLRRARAVEALGRLRLAKTIPNLAKVANQKVRPDWQGEPSYDLSIMRLAAVQALQRTITSNSKAGELEDKELSRLLALWRKGDRASLARWLKSGAVGSRPLAAFALADLHPRQPDSFDDLLGVWFAVDTPASTRWAVVDALALLDPILVGDRAVRPLVLEKYDKSTELPRPSWDRRQHRYPMIAYLIGKGRIQSSVTDDFLERCLKTIKTVDVKVRAIQSIALLNDQEHRGLLEELAVGDLGGVEMSSKATAEDLRRLQIAAIDALGAVGNSDSLKRLRGGRGDWHSDLERAFYWTSEAIVWRTTR